MKSFLEYLNEGKGSATPVSVKWSEGDKEREDSHKKQAEKGTSKYVSYDSGRDFQNKKGTVKVPPVPNPAGRAARFVTHHEGPRGSGKIHSITTHDEKGNHKVKYFAGNYNSASKYRPGGGPKQGSHTGLHDTPEEAAKEYHSK